MDIKDFTTGIDIEQIKRFEKYSKDRTCPFVKRIFSDKEADYCFSYKNPAEHLAARFCGKEAVHKVLTSFGKQSVDFKDIEILNDENGVPFVKTDNEKFKNIIIKISLSHSKDYAVASVFAIKI